MVHGSASAQHAVVPSPVADGDGTAPAPSPDAPPEPTPFAFDGDALYLGVGLGALPTIGERALSWRLLLTLSVHDYISFELGGSGVHFRALDHHNQDVAANGLGLVAGLRVSADPGAVLRPYGAARLQHVHFWPDPWGDHGDDHASHHRWGAALAVGFDFGLLGPQSRWRMGFDAETLFLTGPGASLVLSTLVTVGVAF